MASKGSKGVWLATDDYTGFTVFANKLRRDFWGALAVKPLKRNLQEIASPLSDPLPVSLFRGSNYENTPTCVGDTAPLYVGNTAIPTNPNNAAFQALGLDPGIGSAEVGCTLQVH
jgi:hypothetical protein